MGKVFNKITAFSIDRPKTVIIIILFITALFGSQFHKITIDTDPENMLESSQEDRVFYDETKQNFGINDLIVVGIIDKNGIFRKETLASVDRIIKEIVKIPGVIIEDVISISTTDNVKSSGGLLDIHPVLKEIPESPEVVEKMHKDIASNPFLNEKIASQDGTALAIYVPIQQKDMSYRISMEMETILERELKPDQEYHIAGLPVAEDTFGHEMFIQMGVTAPLTGLAIMLLLYILFRKVYFTIPPMVLSMISVVWAMGLLIGTGNTVHIMSSMIPIFLMPIAVLDSVHILSEFFDKYKKLVDKRKAIISGMEPLYMPMLFTSITSSIGFASLALADIPPVKIFGLHVAFGIMIAWLLTITLVPAMLSLMNDEKLKRSMLKGERKASIMDRILKPTGQWAFSSGKYIIVGFVVVLAIGVVGIFQININDNPVKWFKEGHKMRLADTAMNKLFGGTYMSYIVADGKTPEAIKHPDTVNYLDKLQANLENNEIVGKTSSIADIVKRINLVLHDNDGKYHIIPETADAVGQFLFLFQSSGDPNDLDNFIDRESRKANIWVQMKSGDNHQMALIEGKFEDFVKENPPPNGIELKWSGLTYINKVWQDLMVKGMLKAILGSFAVVFILMALLFRSVLLGLLSMVPLTGAIVLSYGLVGWFGKDYDMPIAVCSSLSLGLAIDFAIHFLERFKSHYRNNGCDLEKTNKYMFGDPGRAIGRNAVIITFGFLPLLISSLTPYVTVGLFFAMLMAFSTMTTLILLPAFMKVGGNRILSGGVK